MITTTTKRKRNCRKMCSSPMIGCGRRSISMRLVVIFFVLATVRVAAAEPGSAVVVLYNSDMPESKQVADYYAQRRNVPAGQIFGLPLPKGEAMSRIDYVDNLEKPFLQKIEAAKLYTPGT